MLQKQVVDRSTLNLLLELNHTKELQHFALGGGTALALRLGHRISDLDFFTEKDFDSTVLVEELSGKYNINDITTAKNSISCTIQFGDNKIKIDILKHGYELLSPPLKLENIVLYSLEDIVAMKLNALANRGAKKDFYDIYSLLVQFTFKEMLSLFEKKYSRINSFSVIKSLVYFDDAENEPDPISLVGVDWGDIKKKITQVVRTI